MIFDQPNSEFLNLGTISDGAYIAASGFRLTNSDSGRIFGSVTFNVGGSFLTNELGGIIRGASTDYIPAEIVVQGSTGADTIVNSGLIRGSVSLGGGNDIFVDRDGQQYGSIAFGSGNDVYRLEGAFARFPWADGGDGYDRFVMANTNYQVWGENLVGFEELVLERGGNLENFSGYQTIVLASTEDYRFFNFLRCRNPSVDLLLRGDSVALTWSEVRSIAGSESSDAVQLGSGTSIGGDINLAGGDDWLLLSTSDAGTPLSLAGSVYGGAGRDTIELHNGFELSGTYDLSAFRGFEALWANSSYVQDFTMRVSNVRDVSDIRVGQGATLVLTATDLANANISGAFGGNVVLETGVRIGRYGAPLESPWDQRVDLAQGDDLLSSILINRGQVVGDIRFYIGDDLYDGREGLVGGTVYGNAGNDILLGGSGSERLEGGFGSDILSGGGGPDTLVGGAGRDTFRDTASGLNGDTIADLEIGDRILVTDALLSGFNATLSRGVLSFSGGTVMVPGARGRLVISTAAEGGVEIRLAPDVEADFNGDGRSDVVLQSSTGAISVWRGQSDGSLVEVGGLAANPLDSNWKVAGIGDFNGDGRDDVLWRHMSGVIGQWSGQSGAFTNNSGVAANPVDNGWLVAGIADYNGDGRDDILWRHYSGEIGQWLARADGSFANNGGAAANQVDLSWTIVASGDFNGDGRADVIWQHRSGVYAEWQGSDSGKLTNVGAVLSGANGRVVGSGDFNGDGRDDLLLRDPYNGAIGLWLGKADGQFTSSVPLRPAPDLSWQVVAIGDFDGNGLDDLLWKHFTGVTATWLGTANGGFANNGTGLSTPSGWSIQSPDIWLV